MNPPSALFGAMNRERKPFTYTPGGLDLSEIKSERMAQRLMRNAMNQGVPETPAHSIKSPPASGIPVAIPNFNCLPVQVFPSFQLPANPKSLLRTRSNPDGSKPVLSNKVSKVPQFIDNVDKNTNKQYINQSQNYENSLPNSNNSYNVTENSFCTLPKANYGIIINNEPATYSNDNLINDFEIDKSRNTQRDANGIYSFDTTKNMNNNTPYNNSIQENPFKIHTDMKEDTTENENKQEEISVKKSTLKTENDAKNQNGDTETAVIVKLPTKKSAAKTETKVEVVQKSLPDGSVQEVKTTTTRTTIDGKTEISTKTETKTLSKEETDEETYDEEEEEIEDEEVESKKTNVTVESITENAEVKADNISSKNTTTENEKIDKKQNIIENGGIIKQEENIETSTTKKVVVIQSEVHDSEEEAEEVEEDVEEEVEEEEEEDVDQDVEEVIVMKKQNITNSESNDTQDEENELEKNSNDKENTTEENEEDEDNQIDEERKLDEDKEEENEKESKESSLIKEKEDGEENENIDSQIESDQKVRINENDNENDPKDNNETADRDNDKEETISDLPKENSKPVNNLEVDKSEVKAEEIIIPIQTDTISNNISEKCDMKQSEKLHTEIKNSFREPSIPLEKVEEVEIKPIGTPAQEIITKSHKEIISTTTDKSTGAQSTQTQYNIIENIVSVNRTTKTLDHAYEQAGEYTIPVVKTSLIPENSGILPPAPIFNRTYQSNYSNEPSSERRHSLLLERLSVERQIPTPSIYQTDNSYSNIAYDGRQLPNEPQAEIVIESNVKPSMVNKNQQWYSRKDSYDTITPTGAIPSQQWNQPQPQPQPQPQQQAQQQQPQYQPQVQPQYQYTPQNQCYNQTMNSQTQYSPQPQQQPAFTETYKQPSNTYNQNSYSSYTPKPSWVSSTVDPKPTSLSQSNQYSFESESYQKSTHNQNSYVPPPWEQDAGYNVNNFNQNTYQPQPAPITPIVNPTPSWKPPNNKFAKIPTSSYVPPAPNQSFVKPASAADAPKLSGRKTYYSEYERRYITVPESTYIPTETKYQPQPDPSPQYYYDQNEPVETIEPQWRKELREFTEKTQTSSQTIETSVRPPWEAEPKYVTSSEQSNTQTWNQTLRPRSYRERSIESEYTSTAKDWSKSNSLGRGRPQSSYINNLKRIPERPRGVSVDRYNPNIYQSPLSGEHPPVQSQTLDPAIHPKPHYNPNVPAYHSRASAEPREQPVYNTQPRGWVDPRAAPPVQSRSFKYLQWITGTED